jgi:hypothetical protein
MDNQKDTKHPCTCCGYWTLPEKAGNTFQVCPVCYWEDDGVQLNDPAYAGGANQVSLAQAKENYASFGAIEARFQEYVRLPWKEEMELNGGADS